MWKPHLLHADYILLNSHSQLITTIISWYTKCSRQVKIFSTLVRHTSNTSMRDYLVNIDLSYFYVKVSFSACPPGVSWGGPSPHGGLCRYHPAPTFAPSRTAWPPHPPEPCWRAPVERPAAVFHLYPERGPKAPSMFHSSSSGSLESLARRNGRLQLGWFQSGKSKYNWMIIQCNIKKIPII